MQGQRVYQRARRSVYLPSHPSLQRSLAPFRSPMFVAVLHALQGKTDSLLSPYRIDLQRMAVFVYMVVRKKIPCLPVETSSMNKIW